MVVVATMTTTTMMTTTTKARVALDMLAYGGDDGIIPLLSRGEKGGPTIVVLRRYDDEVCALAEFPDGLRVTVGFDEGSTKVYSYDGWSLRCHATTTATTGRGGGWRRHTFAEPQDNDNNDDGLFLTGQRRLRQQ